MKKAVLAISAFLLLANVSCKDKSESINVNPEDEVGEIKLPPRVEPEAVSYAIAKTKEWLAENKSDSQKMNLVLAANRTDEKNISAMDSIIVPTDFTGDIAYYLPFPFEVPALQKVDKIILFSYPSQTFATYEHGALIHTGPTNMGSKKHLTPTGLFFSNWKAEETTSTFDDEWELKWNFNIENKEGVGWHEYSLPGYPASHSCLRLQEKDAKVLYDWADQWVLVDDQTVKVKGTPTVVFGAYDFENGKPWMRLNTNPKALNLSAADIEKVVSPFMTEIMKEQQNRRAQKNVAAK